MIQCIIYDLLETKTDRPTKDCIMKSTKVRLLMIKHWPRIVVVNNHGDDKPDNNKQRKNVHDNFFPISISKPSCQRETRSCDATGYVVWCRYPGGINISKLNHVYLSQARIRRRQGRDLCYFRAREARGQPIGMVLLGILS